MEWCNPLFFFFNFWLVVAVLGRENEGTRRPHSPRHPSPISPTLRFREMCRAGGPRSRSRRRDQQGRRRSSAGQVSLRAQREGDAAPGPGVRAKAGMEDGSPGLSGPRRGRGCRSRGSAHRSRRGVGVGLRITPPVRGLRGVAPTERRGCGWAAAGVPAGERGPRVCPRVAACARARASLCGEAARRCLRVPGACARGCLAPCLCRCLGVSEEGACARRARAPAPGGAALAAGSAGR